MKQEGELFTFNSTGRQFKHSIDGLSFNSDGRIQEGTDGVIELLDEEGYGDYSLELSIEEKKEIAFYMIEQWKKFGGIS